MATLVSMTGAAFDELPEDEERNWELLEGELIEMPGATLRHQRIVMILAGSLATYFRQHRGGTVAPDVEFAFGERSRLRPDVAVLFADRLASVDPDKVPVRVCPNIVVEVISPSERSIKTARKVWTYLRAGVQEVWQVDSENQKVLVYRTPKSATVIDPGENLSTPLLPEWSLPVAELFEA